MKHGRWVGLAVWLMAVAPGAAYAAPDSNEDTPMDMGSHPETMMDGGMFSYGDMMRARQEMTLDVMKMMKEVMGILKDLDHRPTKADRERLAGMMTDLDAMIKRYSDIQAQIRSMHFGMSYDPDSDMEDEAGSDLDSDDGAEMDEGRDRE